ncbi:NAD(P)H-binding protein [Novosphingobium sp. M1R2S20]|uniref:NAD(P)H-binding protein n=1 Tax=Novosphingobium rhizovicinum TaxID=3228928 RepID=A0ABV3RFZ1_9SPHN
MSRLPHAETRVCLVGATGLIGSLALEGAHGRESLQLTVIARRQPMGAGPPSVRVLCGETAHWSDFIASSQADVLVCVLGTTRAKAGSPAAFQAVDRDLVLTCGRAARAAGVERMIVVSSVGANSGSRNLYLRTKGEMEAGLVQLGFGRLDILRPAQLIGHRDERRALESIAQAAANLLDILMRGPLRRYHSIAAQDVASAILALAEQSEPGCFIHKYDDILKAARSL